MVTPRPPRPETAPLFDLAPVTRRALPVLGEQKDIRYYGRLARSIFNGPESTGMGFWSINPYVGCAFGCAYCYARYTHRYAFERLASGAATETAESLGALPPWLAFERRILVKENAPALVRHSLRYGSEKHLALVDADTVVIGTATDPYQPAERRFRVTRGILEALAEHEGLSVVIISKSPLVTRDVDLLRRLARQGTVEVHVTITTLDRDLARRIEPRAPTPDARVRGLARLRENGIRAGVNVMPVLPGITDDPAKLDQLIATVARAGATFINAAALRLQSAARERYLPFIEQEFPELAARYHATYDHDHHAGKRYREGLSDFFRKTCAKYRVPFGHGGGGGEGDNEPERKRRVSPREQQVEMWPDASTPTRGPWPLPPGPVP